MAQKSEYSRVKIVSDLKICLQTLNEFKWLLDSYILDYFTEDHVKKLPLSWREHLNKVSPQILGQWVIHSEQTKSNFDLVWPLSLLCLQKISQSVSLPRTPNPTTDKSTQDVQSKTEKQKSNETIKITSQKHGKCERNIKDHLSDLLVEHPKLKNLFCKHVKPKKRYEILKMAGITNDLAKKVNVSYVVDIGSGLGHLSRTLSYGYQLRVCGLETQKLLIDQASVLDAELEVTASKHLTVPDMDILRAHRPVHVQKTVTFNMEPTALTEILMKGFENVDEEVEFGIVGLHPCGDLAAILLNLFLGCSKAKFIVLVGCCYHKLSIKSDGKRGIGYPLSQFVQNKNEELSYEARALACHAIDTYCERLEANDYDHLKVHCYRATVETFIKRHWPEFRRSGLTSVRHTPQLSFSQYCEKALKKLNVIIPQDEMDSNETTNNLTRWKEVVVYYTLRLILAPLVETVILLDRLLYLLENDIECSLFAAFEPKVSPRNHILAATKS